MRQTTHQAHDNLTSKIPVWITYKGFSMTPHRPTHMAEQLTRSRHKKRGSKTASNNASRTLNFTPHRHAQCSICISASILRPFSFQRISKTSEQETHNKCNGWCWSWSVCHIVPNHPFDGSTSLPSRVDFKCKTKKGIRKSSKQHKVLYFWSKNNPKQISVRLWENRNTDRKKKATDKVHAQVRFITFSRWWLVSTVFVLAVIIKS